MTAADVLLLVPASIIGGAMNAVAGGGSFVTFPALLFTGVPTIEANATNTVALWPGSLASAGAYRREATAQMSTLVSLGAASLTGGVLGAILLLHTHPATFLQILPWLMLGATLLFTFGGRITKLLRAGNRNSELVSRKNLYVVCILQFIISIYGGFFGGGIGILMLAALALMGMTDIHDMNALKTILASLINGVAVITFVVSHKVWWLQAVVMIIGAIIGGYGGAAIAKKTEPAHVRGFVITIGFTISAIFFARLFIR